MYYVNLFWSLKYYAHRWCLVLNCSSSKHLVHPAASMQFVIKNYQLRCSHFPYSIFFAGWKCKKGERNRKINKLTVFHHKMGQDLLEWWSSFHDRGYVAKPCLYFWACWLQRQDFWRICPILSTATLKLHTTLLYQHVKYCSLPPRLKENCGMIWRNVSTPTSPTELVGFVFLTQMSELTKTPSNSGKGFMCWVRTQL